jgi:hypothetical protein
MSEVEAASAAPGEKRSAGRPRKNPEPAGVPALAKASESGDPAVQQLLGARYTAQQNGDADGVAAADAALAALGFA